MSKTYPEVLADWVKREDASRPDRNIVAFLAVREEVREAVDAGYSITAIWKNMRADGRIAASYETFRRHMKRYLRPVSEAASAALPPTSTSKDGANPAQAALRLPGAAAKPQTKSPDAISGFTFNPKPNLEDLI
jgi:hypothetical protein